ncbi:MAG: hypothetical protein ABI334_05825 [Candidatus Dormiibacterota bacterium]
MPWLKLPDDVFMDRELARLRVNARLLHLMAMDYCARYLTDGWLDDQDIASIAGAQGLGNPDFSIGPRDAAR